MEEESTVEPEMENEVDVGRVAMNLSMLLKSKKKLTAEEFQILEHLWAQLDQIDVPPQETSDDDEARFLEIVKKIESWKLDNSMIWDSGPSQSSAYLKAADDNRKLIEKLESFGVSMNDEQSEMLQKAYSLRQDAMERLEDEFKHLLSQNRHIYGEEKVPTPFSPAADDTIDVRSFMSPGNLSVESSDRRDSCLRFSEELSFDMFNPSVISDMKSIVTLMFSSNYALECSNAYILVRRSELEECLHDLNFENMSVEDVLKLDSKKLLEFTMRTWIHLMKTFVKIHLTKENMLAEQLFSGHGEAHLICFCEASKPSMSQLINFGVAITIGPHMPHTIVSMLQAYDVLSDLLPQIDSLFINEPGFHLRNRYHDLLNTLGESIASAFDDFFKIVAAINTTRPVLGGSIHPGVRYVMNYLKNLFDYQPTLDVLLERKDDPSSSSASSPMASHFIHIVSALEAKVQESAKGYKDPPLRHIFLMNNLHYIVHKIQDEELHPIFGDRWLKRRIGMFQHEAMAYQRATWGSIELMLKYDKNRDTKVAVREKFRRFTAEFDEVYSLHTTWSIPDNALREDVRIQSTMTVSMAYQRFLKQTENVVSERHIKYSAEELQGLLLDFFKG